MARSLTEDLGFREIERRIYFKVCMFGFDSSYKIAGRVGSGFSSGE